MEKEKIDLFQSIKKHIQKFISRIDANMIVYIGQRFALMLLTLFIIVTVSFVLIRTMPDSPMNDPFVPQYMKDALNEKWGYDKPILTQYWIWLQRIAKWDWGISTNLYQNIKVVDIMKERIGYSMELNIFAVIIAIPIGLGLGTIAALKKNTIIDYIISLLVIFMISIPSFVIALGLQFLFAFELDWVEPFVNYDSTGLVKFTSMLLPIFALATGAIAGMVRVTRAELTEVLTSDFMLLATTKGLTTTQATLRHAFRNSMVPLVGMLIGLFLSLLGGSLIIERLFNIPGIGKVMYESMLNKDYSLTMASIVFYTSIGLSAGILIDVAYGIVDPRIRVGGKKQ